MPNKEILIDCPFFGTEAKTNSITELRDGTYRFNGKRTPMPSERGGLRDITKITHSKDQRRCIIKRKIDTHPKVKDQAIVGFCAICLCNVEGYVQSLE